MNSPAGRAFAFFRILSCFALCFAWAPALYAQSGQISGTVTGPEGTVSGIGVHLTPASCCQPDVAYTTTQPDGSYAFNPVGDGTYLVRVDSAPGSDLRGVYYGGANEFDWDLAATITISGGSSRVADISLGRCATVSGSITGAAPGDQVNIQLTDVVSGRYRGGVGTAGGGAYLIPCPAPGVYRAFADPWGSGLAYQYYAGQSQSDRATGVVVADNADVAGIDFALVPGATISGSVTLDPPPGDPSAVFPRIWVNAMDAYTYQNLRGTNLSADGTFAIANLPPGTYIIEVLSLIHI